MRLILKIPLKRKSFKKNFELAIMKILLWSSYEMLIMGLKDKQYVRI